MPPASAATGVAPGAAAWRLTRSTEPSRAVQAEDLRRAGVGRDCRARHLPDGVLGFVGRRRVGLGSRRRIAAGAGRRRIGRAGRRRHRPRRPSGRRRRRSSSGWAHWWSRRQRRGRRARWWSRRVPSWSMGSLLRGRRRGARREHGAGDEVGGRALERDVAPVVGDRRVAAVAVGGRRRRRRRPRHCRRGAAGLAVPHVDLRRGVAARRRRRSTTPGPGRRRPASDGERHEPTVVGDRRFVQAVVAEGRRRRRGRAAGDRLGAALLAERDRAVDDGDAEHAPSAAVALRTLRV